MLNLTAQGCRLLVESTPEAITYWDKNLKLVDANPAVVQQTGVPLATLLGKTSQELNQLHSLVTPGLEKLQFVFLTGQATQDNHSRTTSTSTKFYHSRLLPEQQPDGSVERVLVITRDITPLQKAKRAVKKSKKLLQAVTDSCPVGMAIVKSLRDTVGTITDFEYRWLNPLAQSYAGQPVVGRRMLEVYPHVKETGLFDAYVQAVENQLPVNFEEHYSPTSHWFRWQGVRMEDGLFVTFEDITQQKQAEAQIKEQAHYLQRITETVPDMISVIDLDTRATTFLNSAIFASHGFQAEQLIAKSPAEKAALIYPEDQSTLAAYFDSFTLAADQDICMAEYRAKTDTGEWKWFAVRGKVFQRDAAGRPTQVLNAVENISERKKADLEIKRHKDFLQSIFDTTLLSLSILRAIRDERGTIVDFQIVLVNKELARETGRDDLVGKHYAVEYPGIKQAGLFDLMLRVMETGQPGQVEYYYPHEGFNKWYEAMFVKMDDGLIASNLDITERKVAEIELVKSFTVLKQAEEVAGMGSWEYDYTTKNFHWSAGMFHLFGLPVGSAKSPETYLDYVLSEDRSLAEKLVLNIRQYPQPVEETIRIRVNGQTITLRIKGAVLRDDLEQPYKLLGIGLDVSEVARLGQENLKMRLEQQKGLLLAILEAQEEERRRISESLHNGVGQILYATKLNLDQVAQQVSAEIIAPTVKLLSEAIQETRRVSHELVPMVLQDFGLARAMRDLCQKYEPSSLRVNCDVDLESSFESYLELVLYRISQELLTNVTKHAQASEVDLLLAQEEGEITLKVRDNGIGMPSQISKPKGIGLRFIQDQVKLLNGTFTLSRPPAGKGTLVIIQLPVGG